MGKINILDSSIYNHISAGEVVTNPSAVVKELVENSIDAGATKITIEIEGGGINKIRVIDNGSGIENDDVKKAFLSHATSKISSIEDIFNISSLGFRGEALASIGAVSKTNLTTKTRNAEVGTYLEIKGGVFGDLYEKATTDGTVVTVNNLFYNTPARLKFLKQARFEQSEINKMVARFIMGHPSIDFSYYIDGEVFYQSPSGTLSDAIYAVYGADFLQECIKISNSQKGMKISGYISTPIGAKSNTSWQNTYVNGRWVESKCVSIAAYNAYAGHIMKGKFPAFVINLELAPNEVDINVSPQKTEAKFVRDNEVFSFVYTTLLNVLEKNEKLIEEKESIERLQELPIFHDTCPKKAVNVSSFDPTKYDDIKEESSLNVVIEKEEPPQHINKTTVKIFDNYNPVETQKKDEFTFKSESIIMTDVMKNEISKLHTTLNKNSFMEDDSEFKIVGVLFNTYIIVEVGEKFFIIDQHAAHERVKYDNLIEQIKNSEVSIQNLLLPYVLKTNYEESMFLQNNKEALDKLGFKINEFGNNVYEVMTVPNILSDIDLELFFQDIFSELSYLSKQNDLIQDKIATKACKSAVKAGDKLSKQEISLLVEMINASPTPLQCPHGRPFVVEVTKYELEKWFKRIV